MAPRKVTQAQTDSAALQTIAQALTRPKQAVVVGIRNICGSTLGIPASGGEPDISLHPYSPLDPNSVAQVSWLRWTQIRKSGLYRLGLLERFDEILDESATRGPEDKSHEVAPDHERNKLVDPVEFIENGTDKSIREKIGGMTSENNLHRILATVDAKIRELQNKFTVEGDREPGKRALNELPANYAHAERIAQARLDSITPNRTEDGLLPSVKR